MNQLLYNITHRLLYALHPGPAKCFLLFLYSLPPVKLTVVVVASKGINEGRIPTDVPSGTVTRTFTTRNINSKTNQSNLN